MRGLHTASRDPANLPWRAVGMLRRGARAQTSANARGLGAGPRRDRAASGTSAAHRVHLRAEIVEPRRLTRGTLVVSSLEFSGLAIRARSRTPGTTSSRDP